MKQFFKTMFACILGVCIAGMIMMIIGMISIVSVASFSSTPAYTLKPNTVLHLKLQGALQERTKENPFSYLNIEDHTPQVGLDDILKAIRMAKENDQIKGIYIESNGFYAGYASLNEIRNQLIDFRKSKKFIVAYADNYSQQEFYLASVADSLYLNPVGMLDFRGLAVQPMFFKNTLDKLGIEMQVFKVGTFKSAVEPYISTHMSDASREQTVAYTSSIWNNILKNISESRKMTINQLNECADSLTLTEAPEALVKKKLIDRLAYRVEMKTILAKMAGEKKEQNLQLAKVHELVSIPQSLKNTNDQIAIIYAVGEIDGAASGEGVDTRKLTNDLIKIKEDNAIKAVVLRINSPGGSAFGSEQVWKAIEEVKKTKPVAVSMSDVAASGGYYIACGANRIFAEPTTLTGSIGIFGLIPNAGNLLTQKIGLSFDEVKTNRYGNFPTINRAMTPNEKAKMQAYVERGYELFVSRCATGRNMSVNAIKKIAEGRVWTGETAKEIGLVDELGGMDNAIAWVSKKAGIKEYNVIEYPRKKTFIEELITQMDGSISTYFTKAMLGEKYNYFQTLKHIQEIDPLQSKMENIEIY